MRMAEAAADAILFLGMSRTQPGEPDQFGVHLSFFDHQRITVANKLLDKITVCLPREIPIAAGERLHLKANRTLAAGARTTNGELVTVKTVRADGGIELADGRILGKCFREFLPGYPPDAARVFVCALALTNDQAKEPSTKHLLEEWQDYAQQFSDSQPYRDACPENLLRQFGQSVFAMLASELPNLPRMQDPPPDVQVAFTPTKAITFEDAIHQGCAVLAWRRENFESWWQDAQTRLQ